MLLDFESATDRVFVSAPGGRTSHEAGRAHTGRGSLRLEPAQQGAKINLAALLAGREFPGEWTLLGGYVYATRSGRLNVSLQREGRVVAVNAVPLFAGQWTAAMVDLTELEPRTTPTSAGDEVLVLETEHGSAVWLDDLVLIDNSQILVADPSEEVSSRWSIVRKGLQIIGDARGRFRFSLPTQHPTGTSWRLQEANELRAQFESVDGTRRLVVYADGRAYHDGSYRPIGRPAREMPELVAAHQSPAQINVAPELGRVLRHTPGDANNDGYNETAGAYQLQAVGPRLELHFVPQSSPVLWPVLEVAGLPEGKLLATVEGRLIERIVRLENGDALIIPPVRIDRPTAISIRVQ